jgi:hypothetical protein
MNRLAAAAALALSTQLALVAFSAGSQASAAVAATAGANGTIGLSGANFPVSESAGSVLVTAVRTGATKGAMSVRWTTANGTALASTYYTPSSGTLTWADGDGSSKTFTIPVNSAAAFSGSKWFKVLLAPGANTVMGSHTNAIVTITSSVSTTSAPPPPPPVVVKSIKEWGVVCDDTTDQSSQLADALTAAGGGAFTLQIDCPVRFHTGTNIHNTINVPDGVTVQFIGAGELLTVSGGATALNMPHATAVTLSNWSLTYL